MQNSSNLDRCRNRLSQALNMTLDEVDFMITVFTHVSAVINELAPIGLGPGMKLAMELLTSKATHEDSIRMIAAKMLFRQICLVRNNLPTVTYALGIQTATGRTMAYDIPSTLKGFPAVDKATLHTADGQGFGYLLYPQQIACGGPHEGKPCPKCHNTGLMTALYAGMEVADIINELFKEENQIRPNVNVPYSPTAS